MKSVGSSREENIKAVTPIVDVFTSHISGMINA